MDKTYGPSNRSAINLGLAGALTVGLSQDQSKHLSSTGFWRLILI
jgi:hypothetical protein